MQKIFSVLKNTKTRFRSILSGLSFYTYDYRKNVLNGLDMEEIIDYYRKLCIIIL